MQQEFEKYTQEDLEVWNTLFTRQVENFQGKASEVYQKCLAQMNPVINADELPNFKKINTFFEQSTGWAIECVPGLIEVDDFFTLLAKKKFPSSTWLRSKDKMEYLEEPDMFHDTFGHIPLLCDPSYAAFMQKFGELGMRFIDSPDHLKQLQRLYWFTIEFGLMKENGQLRIYGAGILSSYGETNLALEATQKEHRAFDLEEIIQQDFVTSEMQSLYFVLSDLAQLENSVIELAAKWEKPVLTTS